MQLDVNFHYLYNATVRFVLLYVLFMLLLRNCMSYPQTALLQTTRHRSCFQLAKSYLSPLAYQDAAESKGLHRSSCFIQCNVNHVVYTWFSTTTAKDKDIYRDETKAETDVPSYTYAGRQTYRHTDIQTYSHADICTYIPRTYRQDSPLTPSTGDRQTGKQTQIQIQRQKQRQRHRKRQRQRQRQRHRQRWKQRQTYRHTRLAKLIWAILGPPWAALGPPWGHLGAILGPP